MLDRKISQGSLSAGEKQLLALARATLRRTNVVLMDEATSQVDSNLDDKVSSCVGCSTGNTIDEEKKIQQTIREELSGAIVITIAHRLKTVMDYDRILVLDKGRIVEFDTPAKLLHTRGGMFREMCRRSADWPIFLRMVSGKAGTTSEASG